MATKEEIEIFITEDGRVRYHIRGILGKRCADVARDIARASGTLVDSRFTSEYYLAEEKTTGKVESRNQGNPDSGN